MLLLGGDDPSAGDQPDTKAVFDLDSRRLIETARIMRDRRELPNGKAIAGEPQFFIGAADMPIDPPPDWRPDALRGKIAADLKTVGADSTIADRLLVTGQLLRPAGPDEFAAAVDEQRALVAAAAKGLGLKAAQ